MKINNILLGHHQDDLFENFFIRMLRGSGLKGLSAMKPLRKIDSKLTLCRPLLDVRKNFLIRISKNTFGKYIKDPSNKDEKYLRTKIRNLKKPLENSGVKYEQIFKSIQNLSFSRSTLDNYFEKICTFFNCIALSFINFNYLGLN